MSQGVALAWTVLEEAVSDHVLDSIIAKMTDDQYETRNIDALWDKFEEYAKGAITDLSGEFEAMQDRIIQWQWPTEGNYEAQVTQAVTDLRAFVLEASNIDDADYPYTEAMATALSRKRMPPRMAHERTNYENLRTLAALSIRAIRDALYYDTHPEQEPHHAVMIALDRATGGDGTDTA